MNSLKKYLFFIVIAISFNSFSQSKTKDYYNEIMNLSISKIQKQQKIEQLFNENSFKDLNLAQYYYEFSKWNWTQLKDEKKAIEYASKANDIFSEDKDLDISLYKKNLYNLIIFYSNSNYPDYNNALYFLEHLIENSNINEVILGKAYKKKGDIFKALGDFQKAIINYENSERILLKSNNKRQLLNTYISLSAAYVEYGDSFYVDAFFENQKKLDNIENDIGLSNTQKIIISINKGAIYTTTTNYSKALDSYSKALRFAKVNNDSSNVYKSLIGLSVVFKKMENYNKSNSILDESKKYNSNNKLFESTYYNNKADLFLKKEDYKNALLNYNNAIVIIVDSENNKSLNHLPSIDNIKISPYIKDILDYLIDKANGWMLYYENTSNISYLKEAEKTIVLADQVFDMLYFESREELSKLFWRKRASDLYLKGVKVSSLLSEPKKAFYYMEKNKGLLLLENINTVKAKNLAKIPSKILERETVLLSQIKKLQNTITSQSFSSEEKDSIKNRIFTYKSFYEKFIDSLEVEFPQYYKFKKKLSIVSIDEVFKNLNEDELVIEYILGNEEGYVLFLSNKETILKKINNIPLLNKQIETFQKQIEHPFVNSEDAIAYQNNATSLFHQLFPFEENIHLIENKTLQIIPDGILQNIPFEALTTSKENKLEASYLLKKTDVYYQYSLSLSWQHKNVKSNQENSFVGFLPIEYANNSFSKLSKSFSEIESITPYFKNKIYSYDKATKDQFLTSYNNNSIVHISTHGGVNDKTPWLAFYDQKLQLDELYFLKQLKELVVLSACKTSIGEHKKGEGQYSITRGFINSGAKSVLSTLWDVNEKASSEIIAIFYKGISDGHYKSSSLKTAKISYLENNKNTSLSSPYYWSSIVLTGNNNTIELDNTFSYSYLILGLIVLIMLVLLIKIILRRITY